MYTEDSGGIRQIICEIVSAWKLMQRTSAKSRITMRLLNGNMPF